MTWKEYKKEVNQAYLDGDFKPSAGHIVEGILSVRGTELKRMDIIHQVSFETGIDTRDVGKNIHPILNNLMRNGNIIHPRHGYWQAI